jgi:hypothetical protein
MQNQINGTVQRFNTITKPYRRPWASADFFPGESKNFPGGRGARAPPADAHAKDMKKHCRQNAFIESKNLVNQKQTCEIKLHLVISLKMISQEQKIISLF